MALESQAASDGELRRLEALLQLAAVTIRHHEVGELFLGLSETLHKFTAFEVAGVCLHDPLKNTLSLRVWEGGQMGDAPVELPMEDTTAGWVWENQQPLAFADVQNEQRFSTCLNIVRKMGIRSFCELPLTTSQRRLGTLSIGSSQLNLYDERDVQLLLAAAQIVALSLENAMSRALLEQEKERLQALLEINATLVANSEIREVFPVISGAIRRVLAHEHASLWFYDDSTQSFRSHGLVSPSSQESLSANADVPLHDSPAGRAFLAMEPKIYNYEDLTSMQRGVVQILLDHDFRSLCCIPMATAKGPIGTLNLASRKDRAFQTQDISLLKQIASQLAIALDNSRAHREVAQFRDKLAEEKRYLQGEIHETLNFEEIVGESPILYETLHHAKTVAPTPTTVLVLGETGTGKELLARAIHRMSPRKDAIFVKMNCAAIPTGLLESELFGHEKGAFTGAISQKIGRLELADKGTLLLDEVGDIPLELQPKLLRVLQDREFERLGSVRTIRVNVRIIAATNRNLAVRMEEGEFRSDLYYRLNVFPIRMPALRERRGDIPLLVRYFVQKFSQSMNKQIGRIPTEAMQALESWPWPGNIRELENFIERSVILTEGPVLRAPLGELVEPANKPDSDNTLLGLERDLIVRILRETGGVIAGAHGAAIRLGVKRTTLQSMILRFHIARDEYH